jgi:Peptidase M15
MAAVYLTEVPNAPKSIEMPTTAGRAVPAIRVKAPDEKVNMSQEIAAMQQNALPGGFQAGMDRAANAAGQGQMAMGKAIGEGATQFSNMLGKAVWVLHDINEKALNLADKTASIEAQNNREVIAAKFDADTAGMPYSEKMKLWPKYQEQLSGLNSKLAGRPSTLGIIGAEDRAFGQSTLYGIQAKNGLKIIEDKTALLNQTVEEAIKLGTPEAIAEGRRANDAGHASQVYNDAQYYDNEGKFLVASKQYLINEAVQTRPEWVEEQASKAMKNEENELFTGTEDKSMVNNAYTAGHNEVIRRQQEKQGDLTERLYKGEKFRKEDLVKEMNAAGMSPEQQATVLKQHEATPIPYDDSKVATAIEAVNNYDGRKDMTATGHQSLAQFDATRKLIVETVPQEHQQMLLTQLDKKRKDTLDVGRTEKPQAAELTAAKADAAELWKAGLFRDEKGEKIATGRDEKGNIVDEKAYQTGSARYVEVVRSLEKYAADHPEFTSGELMEHMHGLVFGVVNANVDKAGLTPRVEPLPPGQGRTGAGYYDKLSVPGSPKLPKLSDPFSPPTEEEVKARERGEVPPAGGAPRMVAVNVYDSDYNVRGFREAAMEASPDLLKQVKRERDIFDQLLKTPGSMREKLKAVGSDSLDPDHQGGIMRETLRVAKEEGIPDEVAGEKVLRRLQQRANKDITEIEEALKAPPKTVDTNRVTNTLRTNEAFDRATMGQDRRMTYVTNFTPGKGDIGMEGKDEVKDRSGPAYTMEKYLAGTVPWVSVAVDEDSDLRGKFFVSTDPEFKGVVFKAEDIGPALRGKGDGQIDVAWGDGRKAYTDSKANVQIVVTDPVTARNIAAGRKSGPGGPPITVPGVNPRLIGKLENLQAEFGRFNIVSGYRDPAKNARVGGARGSQHIHGNAVDINVSAMSHAERKKLIRAASESGITGIGVYANNVHFDLGKRRAWGPSHGRESVPSWAEGEIQQHLNRRA